MGRFKAMRGTLIHALKVELGRLTMTMRRAIIAVGLIVVGLSVEAGAKCPTETAEVYGHLRCFFKPDYKVLVTLIFKKNQLEAYAEETSLDIRDDSFQGRVEFSSFVSYNPLTGGHQCSRQPSSVLVRFITAEGTEWDRKVLKFPDDFSYDEKNGRYKLRSGITLHGWC
jgi:hypothetical protein